LQGGPPSHGPNRNELLLRRAQGLSDLAKLTIVVENYMSRSSFTYHLLHLEEEEVFGFAKWHVDCPPSGDNDSHCPNCVNFSCPWITNPTTKSNIVENVLMRQLHFGFSNLLPLVPWGGLELKETICVNGQWCIKHCPPNSTIQCFAL